MSDYLYFFVRPCLVSVFVVSPVHETRYTSGEGKHWGHPAETLGKIPNEAKVLLTSNTVPAAGVSSELREKFSSCDLVIGSSLTTKDPNRGCISFSRNVKGRGRPIQHGWRL